MLFEEHGSETVQGCVLFELLTVSHKKYLNNEEHRGNLGFVSS